MTSSGHSSARQLKNPARWLIWGLIIAGFIGFLDASYLTIAHYTGAEIDCSIIKGCSEVLASKYSVIPIIGVPMALMGALYYLIILLSSLFYYDTKNQKILKIIPPLTTLGFLFTLWLVYLQIFVIEAICQYCMLSAITSTILFIFGMIIFFKKK